MPGLVYLYEAKNRVIVKNQEDVLGITESNLGGNGSFGAKLHCDNL